MTVRIHAQPKASLLSAPEQAVRPGNKAWCVRQGKLWVVPLQVAALLAPSRAIIDADACSLSVDDWLVVSPMAYPRNGMAVREERLE